MTTARTLAILMMLVPSLLVGGSALAKKPKGKPVDDKAAWGESDDFNSALGGSSSAKPAAAAATAAPAKAAEEPAKPVEAEAAKPAEPEPARVTPAEPAPEAAQPVVRLDASPPAGDVAAIGTPQKSLAAAGNADSPEGVTWKASGWDVTLYGYAALNVMQDSTQSFGSSTGNTIIQRRGTIRGNSLQAQATARDSRLGLRLAAPKIGSVKSSVNIETDFNNTPPIEYTEANAVTNAAFRMRHFYLKVETPVIDIIAGQYHDLFAWGGKGFYPSTLNFLGVTGQVYHRQPQIRLSKIIGPGSALEVEGAGAVLRPVQKNGGYPDIEGGLRLTFNGWTGARQQAYGQPGIGAASIGISGIYRHFEVAQFLEFPGGTVPGNGFGGVLNVFLPIIPASSNKKRGNSLSVTGEYSRGTGIADMYTDLTGGLLFPALPNPTGRDTSAVPPPVYPQNIDTGIVTFDGDNRLRTCNWEGFVAGAQYYLPIADGRVWISGIHSQIKSSNIVEITPRPGWGGVYTKSKYYDGSLFIAITDFVQLGASFSMIDQTLGDGVLTRNYRTSFATHMFF